MGKLIFEYSTMNAGKSTKLLQTAHNYSSLNNNVMLLKSSIDTRHQGFISSRIGLEKECFLIEPKNSILKKYLYFIEEQNIEVILVDEAQFLTKEQVIELRNLTITHNITIICYGLRTTFIGEPFEGSSMLLGLADKLVENITLCVFCSKKATMSLKTDTDGNIIKLNSPLIDVGFESKYKSVCYKHWFENMK